MDNNRDFSFSGRGSIGAGEYGRLKFSGSGNINGDITCTALDSSGSMTASGNIICAEVIDCSGAFKCSGNVQTDKLDTSGSTTIEQNLECRLLDSSGSVKIGGDFSGGMIDSSGSVQIQGSILSGSLDASGSVKVAHNVKVDQADIHGALKVGGDCEAEKFFSTGKITIDGLLNAEEIMIKLSKTESLIGEIGCERIEVKRGLLSGLFEIPMFSGKLITNSIEGDEIILENTKAKIVRGNKVSIGGGCEIDAVEYTDTFEKANDAVVRDLKKVGSDGNI